MRNPDAKTGFHFPTTPRVTHGKSDASSTEDEFGSSLRAHVSTVAIYGTKPANFTIWLVWILSRTGKILLQKSALALLSFAYSSLSIWVTLGRLKVTTCI